MDAVNVRIHYAVAGSGPLLIFLHGFPEFWYAWQRQLEIFSATHRAVAMDLRGYNLSSKPRRDSAYEPATVARDIIALADELGAQKFSIVGHDWGGIIAWRLADLYPDRLERLIIINAPHPAILAREIRSNPAQLRASSYVLFLTLPGAARMLTAFNCVILRKRFLEPAMRRGWMTAEQAQHYLDAWNQPRGMHAALGYYRQIRAFRRLFRRDTDETVGIIDVQTLVIWGERDDALVPRNLDGLELYVRRLRIERLPEATHWVVHEFPEVVERLIREFLPTADVTAGLSLANPREK